MFYTGMNIILRLSSRTMTEVTIEQYVKQQIELMQQQGINPVAVMLGHEDWLYFSVLNRTGFVGESIF